MSARTKLSIAEPREANTLDAQKSNPLWWAREPWFEICGRIRSPHQALARELPDWRTVPWAAWAAQFREPWPGDADFEDYWIEEVGLRLAHLPNLPLGVAASPNELAVLRALMMQSRPKP